MNYLPGMCQLLSKCHLLLGSIICYWLILWIYPFTIYLTISWGFTMDQA